MDEQRPGKAMKKTVRQVRKESPRYHKEVRQVRKESPRYHKEERRVFKPHRKSSPGLDDLE